MLTVDDRALESSRRPVASPSATRRPSDIVSTMAEELRSRALWLEVADRLRQRILAGDLAPGERLTEVDLAATFSVSRGPIREAIRQLAGEGLVVELPRRGAIVSMLEGRDLIEVYAVREALESAALRPIVARASDAELGALEPILDAFEAPDRTYLDRAEDDLAFHRALVRLSDNSRLIEMYEQMLRQTMLLLRAAAATRPELRAEMPVGIHRDVLSALRARDADAARAALERHYRHALRRLG